MAEVYIVVTQPVPPAAEQRQRFRMKGTAMAYVKRHLPRLNTPVAVKKQVEAGATVGAVYDEGTGLYWITVDTWTYHPDGRIDHVRA